VTRVPADHAFTLLRDVYGLPDADIRKLDPAALAEKIQRVHKGFSAEHEFAAIASWLGKCSLISQLDNVLHTSATYRAPDFLVVANHKGQDVPFLVEVKSNDTDKLVWSANYLESLQVFAALVKLPLLVAWKRGRLWVLVDSALMLKRVTAFHLPFEEAIKNSLMSALFGNVWIRFAEEFRLELTMKMMGEVDFAAELLPEGTYTFQIEDAAVWGSKGRLTRDQEKQMWWFLATAYSETHFDRTKDVATQQFRADSESMFNLSDVLVTQLLWDKGEEESIDWVSEIRKGLPKPKLDLHTLLSRALDVGAVRYVFDQVPQIIPEFLGKTD